MTADDEPGSLRELLRRLDDLPVPDLRPEIESRARQVATLAVDGRLWIADGDEIVDIDPATSPPTVTRHPFPGVNAFARSSAGIWAITGDGTITELSAAGEPLEPLAQVAFDTPPDGHHFRLAAAGDQLWVGDRGSTRLYAVSTADGAVRPLDIPAPLTGLVATAASAWVLSDGVQVGAGTPTLPNRFDRVDAASGEVTGPFDPGAESGGDRAGAVFADDQAVYVTRIVPFAESRWLRVDGVTGATTEVARGEFYILVGVADGVAWLTGDGAASARDVRTGAMLGGAAFDPTAAPGFGVVVGDTTSLWLVDTARDSVTRYALGPA